MNSYTDTQKEALINAFVFGGCYQPMKITKMGKIIPPIDGSGEK